MSDTPLGKKLRLLIEANGPMTVADYMAHCLGDPAYGYYMTRDPFGARGDFTTAPEVSQMFGEIVGAWLIETWRLTGSPSPVRLVELGPGRGTLMADILRVAAKARAFRDAVALHLVETSPVLRSRQAATLADSSVETAWHSSLKEVPRGPLFLIANEFFDALPIRQFVRVTGKWRERVVGLDANRRLTLGVGPGHIEQALDAADGSIIEIRSAADALIAEIAGRLVADNGAALIIDYGHAVTALAETLQAMRGHTFVNPLAAPGKADLTAHVDFAALAQSASAAGASVLGPMPQGEFLLSLGLAERARRLGANADTAVRDTLHAAIVRLSAADQMGALFNVMALTRPGIRPPPFA